MLRLRLLLGALIILLLGCSLLLRQLECPEDFTCPVDEQFVGRFCLDAGNPRRNYVYLVPGDRSISGHGKGVLPDLSPTEDWEFHGVNPGEEGSRRVILTIEGEGFQGRQYEALLLVDNNSLELADQNGPWQTDTPLTRCP